MNEALYQALLEAPDDEGPKRVFADWLMEQGDPLSEFLALSAAHRQRAPDTREAQRAQDLLIVHWKRWLGPLHRVLSRRRCVFEYGFLRRADLDLVHVDPAFAAELAAAPQWAVVNTIKLFGGTPQHRATVLASPWLRNLQHLDCTDYEERQAPAEPELPGEAPFTFQLKTLDVEGDTLDWLQHRLPTHKLDKLTLRGETPIANLLLRPTELVLVPHSQDLETLTNLVHTSLAHPRAALVVVQASFCELRLEVALRQVEATFSSMGLVQMRALPATLRRLGGDVTLHATHEGRSYRGPADLFAWK